MKIGNIKEVDWQKCLGIAMLLLVLILVGTGFALGLYHYFIGG